MKRILSTIITLMLVGILSVNAFAIGIDMSFKATPDELSSDEYIYSFGHIEEGDNPTEIGIKVGDRKFKLNDPALYNAKVSKRFGIGLADIYNKLGDSYDVIPYYIEDGVEKTGDAFTVTKSDYADTNAGIKLSSISVDGTPLPFFKENMKVYNYGMADEDIELNNPVVTATPKDPSSTVSYQNNPTNVVITVEATDGRTDSYTVNFKPLNTTATVLKASSMSSKRRDSADAPTIIGDDKYTTTVRNSSLNLNIKSNINMYGIIPYITFDIPSDINYENEIIFTTRLRTLNTVPEDLKVYAYAYNEAALPEFASDSSYDHGYLGKVLNPEGWSAYNTVNQTFIDYSCDVTEYIGTLIAAGKKQATIALYFDSDYITELNEAYKAGTYTGPTDLSINAVTSSSVIVNSTAVAYKDGYPKLTYTTLGEYTPKNLAILSDIKVDGTSIANFAEDTYEYTMVIAEGADLPEVTATAKYPGSEVNVVTNGNTKEITVIYGEYSKTYTVTFGVPQTVTKLASYQASKQVQRDEIDYVAVELTDSSISSTVKARAYATTTGSLMAAQHTLLKFDLGEDNIVASAGAELTIRIKANFTQYPQDLKICVYERDPSNTAKRCGPNDLSYMGDLIDSVTIAEGTPINGNASYYDFTFDLSSYFAKLPADQTEAEIIIFFDPDQITQYKNLNIANQYKYDSADFNMGIYPNSAAVEGYTGGGTVFDGAAPRLTYKKI